MEDNRNVCIAIPRELHLRLRQFALERDLTLGEIIQRLLRKLLESEQERAGSGSKFDSSAAYAEKNDRHPQ